MIALLLPAFAACAHTSATSLAVPYTPWSRGGSAVSRAPASAEPTAPEEEVQVGNATWYGARFSGRATASGERFDPTRMTAAHRTLRFGTWVDVRRVDTGESVRVRITDRGPFGHDDRIIDLSRAAAQKLGILKGGVARVEVRVIEAP